MDLDLDLHAVGFNRQQYLRRCSDDNDNVIVIVVRGQRAVTQRHAGVLVLGCSGC